MLNLTINQDALNNNIEIAKQNNIILPTFKQLSNPDLIPEVIQNSLAEVGLWEVNPLNLFRINWHNEPKENGGKFGAVNTIELPSELTGTKARIICMVGKWFPTGCHKVGASYGCLVPRLVSGQFDLKRNKAVWPSTGNYCRGGAFNSKLLSCYNIAVLPEEMSQERFNWLSSIASEVIATPGCESNVKEIFDKVKELRQTQDDVVILNQFEDKGNILWHYAVTGRAIEEAYENSKNENSRFAGVCFSSGSGGVLNSGDYLKEKYPNIKVGVAEALQCSTLLKNGYGGHRIEGIGDKHVPWIHNVKSTDIVIDIDDIAPLRLLRFFNSEEGKAILEQNNIDKCIIDKLNLLGISGIANVLASIKYAKYYELNEDDVVITVLTDSSDMYKSRIEEQNNEEPYNEKLALRDYYSYLCSIKTDNMRELTYNDRKSIHNLKYYTWIEQQGKTIEELNAQWYDHDYWKNIHDQVEVIDEMITDFNKKVNLL